MRHGREARPPARNVNASGLVVNVAKTMFDNGIAARAQTRGQSCHCIKQCLILNSVSAHVAHKQTRQAQQTIVTAK